MGKGLTLLEVGCLIAFAAYGYGASSIGNAKSQDALDRAYAIRHVTVIAIGIIFVATVGVTLYAFAHRGQILKYRRRVSLLLFSLPCCRPLIALTLRAAPVGNPRISALHHRARRVLLPRRVREAHDPLRPRWQHPASPPGRLAPEAEPYERQHRAVHRVRARCTIRCGAHHLRHGCTHPAQEGRGELSIRAVPQTSRASRVERSPLMCWSKRTCANRGFSRGGVVRGCGGPSSLILGRSPATEAALKSVRTT